MSSMARLVVLVMLLATTTSAAPWAYGAGSRDSSTSGGGHTVVRYDQRQEGDWNVRADLENFVILVIPASAAAVAPLPGGTSSLSAASSPVFGGLGILDLLTKAVPFRSALAGKRRKQQQQQRGQQSFRQKYLNRDGAGAGGGDSAGVEQPQLDAQQFIESKTAPYHVDISQSKSNLARLRPQVALQAQGRQTGATDALLSEAEVVRAGAGVGAGVGAGSTKVGEVIVAQSPQVALLRSDAAHVPMILQGLKGRVSRAFVLSLPLEAEEARHHLVEYLPDGTIVPQKKGGGHKKDTSSYHKEKTHHGNKEKLIPTKSSEANEDTEAVVIASSIGPDQKLTLIGAELEQCGPGQERDGLGICRTAI